MPQRDNVLVAVFDVVFHDEGIFHIGDLSLTFALPAHFEGLPVDEEIGSF